MRAKGLVPVEGRRVGKLLALDISTKSGWAVLAASQGDDGIDLLEYGLAQNARKVAGYGGGRYPWTYVEAAEAMAMSIRNLYGKYAPDVVVIEETNGSKSRYTQKILEFMHLRVLLELLREDPHVKVYYQSSGDWRRATGIQLTKEQKKLNTKLATAKRAAKVKGVKLDKKALGIKGKVGKKHLAVNRANELFGLSFKQKDNDTAEAILQGIAFFLDCPLADGT